MRSCRRPGWSTTTWSTAIVTSFERATGKVAGNYAFRIRKSSFFSFVPFISSRIQIGVTPRPDQTVFGFLRERYLGIAFRLVPFLDLIARITPDALADA